MKLYRFSELSEEAKQNAYVLYCDAMNDSDDNRELIISIDDYEAESEYIDMLFDEHGNAQ